LFDDTILFFHDMNEIIILFYETKPSLNKTKRVYITNPHKKTHKNVTKL